MDDIRATGWWWLPETPEARRVGNLTVTEREIRLEVAGVLSDTRSASDRYPAVHGTLDSDSRDITLWGGDVARAWGGTEASAETAWFGCAASGGHLPPEDSIAFSGIRVRISNAVEWARSRPIVEHLPGDQELVRVSDPQRVTAQLRNAQITILIGHTWTLNGDAYKVERVVQFEAKGEARSSRDWWNDFVRPMHLFMSLACDLPCAVTKLEVTAPELDRQLTGDRTIPTWIELSATGQAPKVEPLDAQPWQMLLPYSQFQDRMPELLRRWFEVYPRLKEPLSFLLDLYPGGHHTFLENRFLTVAQSAELLHRRIFDKSSTPSAEHKDRLGRITQAVQSGDRAWLKQKLAWSHEPTVRERFEALVAYSQDAALSRRRPDLAKVSANTRNYLTHYTPSLRRWAAQDEELFWVTEELAYVLQACVLLQLGLEPSVAYERLRGTRRVRHLTSTAARR